MLTAEINLQPGTAGQELDTALRGVALYTMIQMQTPREQRHYLRLQVDYLGVWILADDCVPEVIQDRVDAFNEGVRAEGLAICVHLRIYEDNTLDQLG